jgi:hypothetical protein
MHPRHAHFVLLALAGCASATTAAPSTPSGAPPDASLLAPAQRSPESSAAPAAAPLSFAAEYRRLLEQMVAVDTSHGGETKLSNPLPRSTVRPVCLYKYSSRHLGEATSSPA